MKSRYYRNDIFFIEYLIENKEENIDKIGISLHLDTF